MHETTKTCWLPRFTCNYRRYIFSKKCYTCYKFVSTSQPIKVPVVQNCYSNVRKSSTKILLLSRADAPTGGTEVGAAWKRKSRLPNRASIYIGSKSPPPPLSIRCLLHQGANLFSVSEPLFVTSIQIFLLLSLSVEGNIHLLFAIKSTCASALFPQQEFKSL